MNADKNQFLLICVYLRSSAANTSFLRQMQQHQQPVDQPDAREGPGVTLGSGAHSSTVGGGATYQFTNFLSASSQATYYDQEYFGKSYTGTYLSGTANYGKRLLDMFTFSGSVVDSSNGQGTNALGFIGNVNFFHRFKGWQTS